MEFHYPTLIFTKNPAEKKVVAVRDGVILLQKSLDMQKNIFFFLFLLKFISELLYNLNQNQGCPFQLPLGHHLKQLSNNKPD